MAKFASDTFLDGALNILKNNGNRMVALPSQPADYAAADAAKLAQVTMASGDYTLADGLTSGRRVTVAAKTGVSITTSGTANHLAILDTVNSRLLYVTTCPSQGVTSGGTVSFDAWDVEIRDAA
jgi:hypothetical protein